MSVIACARASCNRATHRHAIDRSRAACRFALSPIALVNAFRPRYHPCLMSESSPQPDPEPQPETREQFVHHVIQIVRDRFPLVKIARAEQSFSLRVNESVASLENLYRMAQLQPETLQHNV